MAKIPKMEIKIEDAEYVQEMMADFAELISQINYSSETDCWDNVYSVVDKIEKKYIKG